MICDRVIILCKSWYKNYYAQKVEIKVLVWIFGIVARPKSRFSQYDYRSEIWFRLYYWRSEIH